MSTYTNFGRWSFKVWRRNLDYVKILQVKYFTGENILIYSTLNPCLYFLYTTTELVGNFDEPSKSEVWGSEGACQVSATIVNANATRAYYL